MTSNSRNSSLRDAFASSNNLLIVLLGAIGDVVRGQVILPLLKKTRPDLKITWLVEPISAEILRLNSLVDAIFIFERSNPFVSFLRLRKELALAKFDITLDLQRHFKSGVFSYYSKSAYRLGFNQSDCKEGNWLFNNYHIPYCGSSDSKVLHYLAFAKELGIDTKQKLNFGFDLLKPEQEIEKLAEPNLGSYVSLVLGSNWPSKDWTKQGYTDLTKRLLLTSSENIVLLGTRQTEALASELTILSPKVRNLVGKTTLTQLAAVLSNSKYAIGPDSGPAHIAAALEVPYISLFGPTEHRRVAPWEMQDLVVKSSLACCGCYRRRCPGLDNLCMRLITVDAIMNKVKLISNNKKSDRSVT